MEYRKLISFGKSSYVVSLPKTWVRQQKLKKGDLLYFDEVKEGLLLQATPPSTEEEERTITIQVDGKELKRVQREIISAYINNYKTITLIGSSIKDQAKEIQDFMQKLVAVEIIEQDSRKIVAKDFLNIKDISIEQIIRKMNMISRSMMGDCKKMFEENTYQSINHRDQDINKFRFLVYRVVRYGLNNPTMVLKQFNLNSIDLVNYWWISFSIEQIGDCIKRIARYMEQTKLSPASKKEFVDLLDKIDKDYADVSKAYFTQNVEAAHTVVNARGELVKACDDFFVRNREAPMIGYLVYNTKGLVANINAIARLVYQGMFAL